MESNAPSAGYFFAYSASLRISADSLDLDAISAKLGLVPTHTHRKDVPSEHGAAYRHDMWCYDAPVEKSEPLFRHIDELWRTLKPHKEYLLQLKKEAAVDVFLGYRSDCETAGVEVPHSSLEMFFALQIPFGLSIIVV